MPIIKHITASQQRELPAFDAGATVRVHQRIKEGDKERTQIFEGLVIARKGGSGANSTFTVRKISNGVGVERIYPSHSPNIVKVEVLKKPEVRRARLYYVRGRQDNAARTRKVKRPTAKAAAKESKE
jgi:large subunit ribosomal protein L19